MNAGSNPCLTALAQRAETIRRDEVRRCKKIRGDAYALALVDQITGSLVESLLSPVVAYVTDHRDADEADRFIRALFNLPDLHECDRVVRTAA